MTVVTGGNPGKPAQSHKPPVYTYIICFYVYMGYNGHKSYNLEIAGEFGEVTKSLWLVTNFVCAKFIQHVTAVTAVVGPIIGVLGS